MKKIIPFTINAIICLSVLASLFATVWLCLEYRAPGVMIGAGAVWSLIGLIAYGMYRDLSS